MEGLGKRLREAAQQLGLSDAEVARRSGLTQGRYSNYVNGRHEPDLATFVRVSNVLGASASALLGQGESGSDGRAALMARVSSLMQAMDEEALGVFAIVGAGLVARSPASVPPPVTKGRRKPGPKARQ